MLGIRRFFPKRTDSSSLGKTSQKWYLTPPKLTGSVANSSFLLHSPRCQNSGSLSWQIISSGPAFLQRTNQLPLGLTHMASSMSKKRTASVTELPESGRADSKKVHVHKTGDWLIHEPHFLAWVRKESTHPVLWLNGPPGSGKTILSRSIVEYLEKSSFTLRYFCDLYSTPRSVAHSLAYQLTRHPELSLEQRGSLTRVIEGQGEKAADEGGFEIWDSLAIVLTGLPATIVVIDGLDEMSRKFNEGLQFQFLKRLIGLAGTSAQVLVSARVEPFIYSTFRQYPEIKVTAERVHDELEKYIADEIHKYPHLCAYDNQIVPLLLSQADGNFMWANLAIIRLSHEKDKEAIFAWLDNMSMPIDGLYADLFHRMYQGLESIDLEAFKTILRYVVMVVRPMCEVEVMNAIYTNSAALFPNIKHKAIELCGPLIKFEDGLIKACHYSLRDFLLNQSTKFPGLGMASSEEVNADIARTCLNYLSHPSFSGSIQETDISKLTEFYPLLEYATLYWVHHVTLSSKTDKDLHDMIHRFFSLSNAFFWVDKLLPAFLSRSVIPIQQRPPQNYRFLLVFTLKSQLFNYFVGEEKSKFDQKISTFLLDSYERALSEALSSKSGNERMVVQRLMDLSEVCTWLPSQKARPITLMEEALQISSALPGDDVLIIDLHQCLADAYKLGGAYENAKKVFEKLLYIGQDLLQPDDDRIMFALDGLGWTKKRLGMLNEAAKDLQKSLDISIKNYGFMSTFTIRSKMTLAEVFSKLGRIQDADLLCEGLKEQLKQHRQNGVPLPKDSISNLNTLAVVYSAQGMYKEAVESYTVLVEDRTNSFGEEHRMTLWPTMQLAIALKNAGEIDSAKSIFENLLPKQEKVLEVDHPDVKETKKHLQSLQGGSA